MVQIKSIIYTIVIIFIILIFAVILFYNSSSVKGAKNTTSIVTTTTTSNTSNSTVRNSFEAYSKNMSQTKNIEIKYVVNEYKLVNITEYSAAFSRNLTLYKYNGNSSISLNLFTPYNKLYAYSNLTTSIFCNAASTSYNFNCNKVSESPASIAYSYISNIYNEPNGTISYNGTDFIANSQCNFYNFYYPNGTEYASACIDPKSGYPLSLNIISLGFSIGAVDVLSNTSKLSLMPEYTFGLNNIICQNNSIALNITALSLLQNYPIIISAYSIKNPSNVPVAYAYTYISNLTAGRSIITLSRWQKPVEGGMLVKVCNPAGICESRVTVC
jgi:hypothetical protein